ncbi:MAG: DUF853 family protein [Planctomycetes bacterium]|nr:DUF853 family protein [Planctomycetota bacterium]
MDLQENTLIGRIIDVQGGEMTASLEDQEQGRAPVVTIGSEDVPVGQIGSYVSIRQAGVCLLAMVTRMTEQEVVATPIMGLSEDMSVRPTFAKRVARLVPLGSIDEKGAFRRGVARYPTTGAEVHALGSKDLEKLFDRFRTKGYDVGTVASHEELRVFLDPSSLFGRHFAILGQTGAGKSWTVAQVVQRAVEVMPRAHIILLDLHGEYGWKDEQGQRRVAFDEAVVQHLDARELEIPYWLMTYAELCDLLVEHSEREAANQTAFFRECLYEARQADNAAQPEADRLDRITIDTPVFFSLSHVLDRLRAKNAEEVPGLKGPKQGPLFGQFDRLLIRIDSKLNDKRYDFLFKPKTRTSSASLVSLLADFVGLGQKKAAVTVIDLSSVPYDVRPTVAAQIGRLAFEFNYWNPAYREFPLLLICEEAHVYIPRTSSSEFAGARASMERIAKEGRKYGVGLGVVSQRPHEVSETVLAQCGTFLCLRVTNPDDQAYVRKLVPESEGDLVSILAGLGRGEALVLGEAVPLPTRVQFDRPDPQPNSDDVDFHAKWQGKDPAIDVAKIVQRWRTQER